MTNPLYYEDFVSYVPLMLLLIELFLLQQNVQKNVLRKHRELTGRYTGYEIGWCFLMDVTAGATQSENRDTVRDDGENGRTTHSLGLSILWEPGLTEYFREPDILVCDDMRREVAGFFLCDTSTDSFRVVLIHVKASTQNHACFTNGLHDVCA